MRAKSFQFIWDPKQFFSTDQDVENWLAKILSAKGIEVHIVATLTKDPLLLWLEPMKKAAPSQKDPLTNVTETFEKLKREEWVTPKVHEENKK